MIKTCVVLNSEIINIGQWDYQYTEVEGEQIANNPLPEGTVIEERDFEYSEEYGWREVGWKPPLSTEEQLRLEMARGNAEMFETILLLMGDVKYV